MQDAGYGQIEIALIDRKPGERSRRDGHPVIGLDPADDLLLLRAAERIVHVPGELDLGIVGLRARVAEEHLGGRHRRHLLEPLGELDRRIVTLGAEQMREGELAHLRRRHLRELLVAVAKRRAPQARHALDIGLAVGVVDEDTLAALEHQGTARAERRKIGVGMNEGLDVADRKIAHGRHMASNFAAQDSRSREPKAISIDWIAIRFNTLPRGMSPRRRGAC